MMCCVSELHTKTWCGGFGGPQGFVAVALLGVVEPGWAWDVLEALKGSLL